MNFSIFLILFENKIDQKKHSLKWLLRDFPIIRESDNRQIVSVIFDFIYSIKYKHSKCYLNSFSDSKLECM